jgi:hypothetical protein
LSILSIISSLAIWSILSIIFNPPSPFRNIVSGLWAGVDQGGAAVVVAGPFGEIALPQKIFVIELKFFEAARATLVNFSSNFFEVPLAWLPSAMFWTPLRAACTIWSCVRLRFSM